VNLRQTERTIVVSTRFFTIIAVFGSMVGSVLMFCLGIYNIYEAFISVFAPQADDGPMFGATAVIGVIESLDRFLIAIVLLYFAYGVYSLFIHPEESEEKLALPSWLRASNVGQLKQVVAELIVVILFVLFLRQALEAFSGADHSLAWNEIATLFVLPVSAMLLGVTLRLIELHPKPKAAPGQPPPPPKGP
jgi:uncharacterized membrane protein YqhA